MRTATPQPSLWSFVAPLMRPYRWHLALALFLNGLHGLAITYQNFVLPMLIGILTAPELTPGGRLDAAIRLAVIYAVVSIFGRMLTWHLGFRVFTWVRERMIFQLRGQFFRHVNHLCLRFHNQHPSGELQAYLFGSPLAQVTAFYQHMSFHVAGAIFTIASTLVILGCQDWVLSSVLVATCVANVWVMTLASKRVKIISTDYMEAEGGVSGHIADLLRGNKAVKLHSMEDRTAQDFDRSVLILADKSYSRDVRQHVEWMKQETISYITLAVLVVAAVWRYSGGHISLAMATAAIVCFQALNGPIAILFGGATLWGSANAALRRITAVLHTASTTPDPVGTQHPVPAKGELTFDAVDFSYSSDAQVLKGMNLRIPYGQRIAIVGPSGAGKTTIIQLLLRLYDPQQGRVLLDGTDLRRCAGPELRRRFGVVPQDPFIFRASLRDNLRASRPDADDATLEHALRLANAWEFVHALPKGLDSKVGEGGSTLSGGQRQRLAIARALLADPPFFIFDEATSALDTVSERLIQEVLERNLGGRTAIFIAHRLATVKNCDRIVVLNDGRVVQDGTFTQLVAAEGLFRELVQGQQLRA